MSYDLIILDCADIANFPGKNERKTGWIMDYIQGIGLDGLTVLDGKSKPTERMKDILSSLERSIGTGADGTPWAAWPHSLSEDGRRCLLSLQYGDDLDNDIIFILGQAESAGVALLDLQGENAVLHVP